MRWQTSIFGNQLFNNFTFGHCIVFVVIVVIVIFIVIVVFVVVVVVEGDD